MILFFLSGNYYDFGNYDTIHTIPLFVSENDIRVLMIFGNFTN